KNAMVLKVRGYTRFLTHSGILRAPNTGYDAKYDPTSPEFSFTKDQATTRYGEIRIVDDPQLK
ncbi:hypothetical protein, partial [uncultured Dialister sp.]|uniref:hypothetical protein n=1 Tax=uncultured Dialister sp. TaxID=278064 RepID=UPI00266FBA5C